MSSEPDRRTLLVFADSLSYYGPQGGLPADDPRIWPNIVASQLGWDLELIGRIGWTSRDVWWAATQDPRSWAALPTISSVGACTSGNALAARSGRPPRDTTAATSAGQATSASCSR